MASSTARHTRGFILKAVLLVFVVICLISLIRSQAALSKSKAELAALQEEKAERQQTVAGLNALLDTGNYDDLVERALRENGYVRADEKVYTDFN